MRIKEIKIEGLFDMFDHTIPLNMEERLSIIYGINGVGKTMVFKILNSLFNYNTDYSVLSKFPFKRLTIVLESEIILRINKDKNGEIELTLEEAGIIKQSSSLKSKFAFRPLKDMVNVEIFFIGTERLNVFQPARKIDRRDNVRGRDRRRTNDYSLIDRVPDDVEKRASVSRYSWEIGNTIKSKREERDKLSNELQQSLHKRILSNDVLTDYTIEQLNEASANIEKRIEELKGVGLLEGIEMDNFKITEDVDAVKRAILAVNIQDIQKTLAIFDDLYPKFQKFIEILNGRRLSFKRIGLSEKGFIFTNDKGKVLNAHDLSSGEQHELVLLYLLLFKIPEDSLILIDEPEISLHITWQKAFLDDMKDIIKLRNFDIVIATHSPAIINGNWDLTIKLGGNGESE